MNEGFTVEQRLAQLREPFPKGTVGKLPKPYKKDSPRAECRVCGGYHGIPAAHLDYVGHAAVTDRLLRVDPHWTWEFAMNDEHGQPSIIHSVDPDRNLWIRLTVCGVTRLGVGDGPNMKERVGDAIRNAAMRFGVALDLWSKEELESGLAAEEDYQKRAVDDQPASAQQPDVLTAARNELWRAAHRHGATDQERTAVVEHTLNGLGTNTMDATAEQLRAAITELDKGAARTKES